MIHFVILLCNTWEKNIHLLFFFDEEKDSKGNSQINNMVIIGKIKKQGELSIFGS